ncbi:MAG: mandelate racemase/muconate lactonizing enzyme family protein [Candidatus Omnitrophica bacterium]|nr:mandelate racemase/muconate lactonizing enzyme family protein [Candidatus Omnitrophota bacterium]
MKTTDIKPKNIRIYFLPVETRVPIKFGPETLTSVTCARVCMEVEDRKGKSAEGWGETPLSVQWVWPGNISYEERHSALKNLCIEIAIKWKNFNFWGHPVDIGYNFQKNLLPKILDEFNRRSRKNSQPVPYLAGLVCCSAFDIALHDAFGIIHNIPTYETYNEKYMNFDLSHFLEPEQDSGISFLKKYPSDFLLNKREENLFAWHLIGGKDPIEKSELTGKEPDDGYPVILEDWIKKDGLKCLKVKLRGNDAIWDYQRLVSAGKKALKNDVLWLSSDFNCTVTDPFYVSDILDRLMKNEPGIYGMLLYVEQPFPYELEENQIDVHSVSARKPLFMDESAHNWQMIRLGRSLGWSGVALKTCKTQTGAILSLCWAKAYGMPLMVQDLSNPMLAQIPHVLLAAYAGTIMGVETNSMQFYPDVSKPEKKVHPGIYKRRHGRINLSTLKGPGFGYCIDKIKRKLPEQVDLKK